MKNATRIFTATFGAIMALAGIEHGIGEILQGNIVPSGVMILSWPDSAFFSNVSGEPAMTIIPNLLITGILAIFFSLLLLVWSVFFVQRKNGGLVMILISAAMLLTGGGIFPPVFGIITGAVGTKINSPLHWWHTRLSPGFRHFLAKLWIWFYFACILSWLSVMPVGYFFGEENWIFILVVLLFALGTFVLTILTGFAREAEAQAPSSSGTLDAIGI